MKWNESGQTSVSYLLVIAVIAVAVGGMLASETMRAAFSELFSDMATRVMGP